MELRFLEFLVTFLTDGIIELACLYSSVVRVRHWYYFTENDEVPRSNRGRGLEV